MPIRDPLQELVLISPDGDVYEAKWIGDKHTVKKKVATFEYPGVDGASTQDNGIASQSFPLTFMFDGVDHKAIASDFEVSLLQRGEWGIVHPTLGALQLQPVSFDFADEPVRAGNVTTIVSTWIKPAPRYEGVSFAEFESKVKIGGENLQSDIAGDLPDAPYEDGDLEGAANFKTWAKDRISTIQNAFDNFYAVNNKVRSEVANTVAALDRLLDQPFVAADAVLGGIATLVQLPATISTLVTDKIRMYAGLFDRFADDRDAELNNNTANVTSARSDDQLQGALFGAIAISTTNGEVGSRSDAVEISNSVTAMLQRNNKLNDRTAAQLGDTTNQRLSKDNYFANIAGYERIRNLAMLTVGYVEDENYAQQVKKVVRLERPVLTNNYAIEQYPALTNEEAYDYFIDTNQLAGDDIVWLAAGRTVVVYV